MSGSSFSFANAGRSAIGIEAPEPGGAKHLNVTVAPIGRDDLSSWRDG